MKFRHYQKALFEFTDLTVDETKEINENVYIDLDADGNLVSMTIEHAKSRANMPEVLVSEVGE